MYNPPSSKEMLLGLLVICFLTCCSCTFFVAHQSSAVQCMMDPAEAIGRVIDNQDAKRKRVRPNVEIDGDVTIVPAPKCNGQQCADCGQQIATVDASDEWLNRLPSGHTAVCNSCAAKRRDVRNVQLRPVPRGTFACCPLTEVISSPADSMARKVLDEGGSASPLPSVVLECSRCGAVFHSSCLGIEDPTLLAYLTLSTTKWLCPSAGCGTAKWLSSTSKGKKKE